MKNHVAKNIELGFRIYLFIMLSIYGWGKVMKDQFFPAGRIPPDIATKTLNIATPHDIAWVFFGTSYTYMCFIGITQGLTAVLLLPERTKLIAVAMLIPIMANVVVVDLCYGVSPGPTWSGILYCFLMGGILYFNRNQLLAVLGALTGSTSQIHVEKRLNGKISVVIILLTITIIAAIEFSVFALLHHYVRATKDFWFD